MLAQGLVEATGADKDPEALADALIFLPNRRAGRELALSFYRVLDRAFVAPSIRPLGDAAEEEDLNAAFGPDALDLPPAYSPAKRRGALAKLIQFWRERQKEQPLPPGSALAAADELASLIDASAFAGGADWDQLKDVAKEFGPDLAEHWRRSATFLDIVMHAWPSHLREQGAVDLQERRLIAAKLVAERWEKSPPKRIVVIAGSTGASRATQILMQAVLKLPKGIVVLPGLDPDLTLSGWAAVSDAPSHPQNTLQQTLRWLGVTVVVPQWPWASESAAQAARRRLINEALAPAGETRGWNDRLKALAQPGSAADLVKLGLSGLTLVEAEDEAEEALVAALLLRETLEKPNATAALVAPEAALGRRVASILERWGVDIAASSGAQLNRTHAGSFLLLLLRWAQDTADPVLLLSLLKHPLTSLGRDAERLRAETSELELAALRGPRRDKTLEDLALRIAEKHPRAATLLRDLAAAHAPFAEVFEGETLDGEAATKACQELAHAVAEAPDASGHDRVWAGSAGMTARQFLEQLQAVASEMGPVDAALWPDLATSIASKMEAPPDAPEHPRIAIWGQLEARLQRRDRMILAGLNEGAWPRPAAADAFLNRSLRKKLNLPDPDERIGLSAHDFAQMANAKEVVLLRAKRVDDKPAVASRWIWRLRTLSAGGLGGMETADDTLHPKAHADPVRWARALRHVKDQDRIKVEPPKPCPPVEKRRLDKFSPSRATVLIRDPYSDFARRILRLPKLRRVGEEIDAAARGEAVHEAIAAFEDAGRQGSLEALIVERLLDKGASPEAIELERPLWLRAANAYLAWSDARAGGVQRSVREKKAGMRFASPIGEVLLEATADRVELLKDGSLAIIDFKTGQTMTAKQVFAGLEPQLALEAAIATETAFGDIGPARTSELIYFRMSTSAAALDPKNGTPLAFADQDKQPVETDAVASKTLQGLKRMIASYARADQPYLSKPRVLSVKIYGDYDRLARRAEWTVEEGEE